MEMEWRTYRACSWTPIAFGNDVTHQQLRLFRVHDLIHLRVASWVGGELNAYGMIPVLAHAQLEDLDELSRRAALSPRHVRRLGRPRETQHERGHGAIYVGGRKQLGASSSGPRRLQTALRREMTSGAPTLAPQKGKTR